MARRVQVPPAMRSHIEQVTRPPTQPVGGLVPQSPPVLPSSFRRLVRRLRPPTWLVQLRVTTILVVIIAVLIGVIVVLATCLAYAQEVPLPPTREQPAWVHTPATSSAVVRGPTAPTAMRRGRAAPAAPSADSSTATGHTGMWVSIALLVGLALGRRTMREGRRQPMATTPSVAAELEPQPAAHYLGATSIVGALRETNQDRVAVRVIADQHVFVIADGLGGLAHGGEAADIAVAYALKRLEAELPEVVAVGVDGVRALLLHIIWGAGVELARSAASGTWGEQDEPGLRTTLVLGIVSTDRYVAAWIGDGGLFVVRADGAIVPLLAPHKDPAVPDELHASLGPATQGHPSWAIAGREPGDLFVGATDGIADAFDTDVVDRIRLALKEASGNATQASSVVVDSLAAESTDTGAPKHTDNLTLALLSDGAP